jgi:hypothetical protein
MNLRQISAAYFVKGEAASLRYYTAELLSGNPGSVVRA